jgi:signal transduction histidine kinase
MDRGRATCGGQKPTAPTTRLIGYSLRINAYYATWLGMRSMREMTEMLGEDLRVDSGSGTGTRAELRVSLDGRFQQPQSTRIW